MDMELQAAIHAVNTVADTIDTFLLPHRRRADSLYNETIRAYRGLRCRDDATQAPIGFLKEEDSMVMPRQGHSLTTTFPFVPPASISHHQPACGGSKEEPNRCGLQQQKVVLMQTRTEGIWVRGEREGSGMPVEEEETRGKQFDEEKKDERDRFVGIRSIRGMSVKVSFIFERMSKIMCPPWWVSWIIFVFDLQVREQHYRDINSARARSHQETAAALRIQHCFRAYRIILHSTSGGPPWDQFRLETEAVALWSKTLTRRALRVLQEQSHKRRHVRGHVARRLHTILSSGPFPHRRFAGFSPNQIRAAEGRTVMAEYHWQW